MSITVAGLVLSLLTPKFLPWEELPSLLHFVFLEKRRIHPFRSKRLQLCRLTHVDCVSASVLGPIYGWKHPRLYRDKANAVHLLAAANVQYTLGVGANNGPPNTLWGSLFLHQLMPILNRLLTDIIIIIALTGKTKHRCWFWFSLYFIWQIENHISTSKHLPTVSLYGIGNKGIRGSHLPFWSNMFISTTGHMATPKSQWKESIVNEAWRIKNCLIGTRYVYSNKLAIYTLKVQKVPKHVNGARLG